MLTFPKNFIWGTSTSAYQSEGAWNTDGKGPSVWDAFCTIPGKTARGESGAVACDHYHRFREDIALMKQMGLKVYRFSIAWSRVMPTGRGDVNPEGIRFYNELIDELIAHDIQPWVALCHFDWPLALEFEIDGWQDARMSKYFAEYARLCFTHFGDRVKHWITFNESWVMAMLSYGQGIFAPGKASRKTTYKAGHHLLLGHARAYRVYDQEFRATQKGQLGITNNCDWREPLTDSPKDKAAAQRALEFFLGWFTDPLYFGDYPASMRERVGAALPEFSAEEKALLKGSLDFLGLNHYTTYLAADAGQNLKKPYKYANAGFSEDHQVNLMPHPDWPLTEMEWPIVPEGLYKLLHWIDKRYHSPIIYVTENGGAFHDTLDNGQVNDKARIDFLQQYIRQAHRALNEGVNLKGYFVWSFLDNFEWALGYEKRFGLHYVDYTTQQRIPKASAHWFKQVMQQNAIQETL